MIGRLTGLLAAKKAPQILIDCQGVGYEADVSMTTYYQLPEVGEPISIWTHLQIKDDAHTLIGFSSEQERKLFRQLIRVNGVGPKMALAILSGINNQEFALCVNQNDVATLTRLPGVGKKTAERLIIEMRDKVEDFAVVAIPAAGSGTDFPDASGSFRREAIEALQALGYKPLDAEKMVKQIEMSHADIDSASTLIRKALQSSVQRQ
ncbi:MAG: Holliday junction branch migration protein RuvA [Gammaproteobacteria bacterium]|nr:Holliday junction branch migration protein RuvA [Gammaproteobacteria bacterium]